MSDVQTNQPLTPIPGPPDLDGVCDIETFYYVVSDGSFLEVLAAEGVLNTEDKAEILWHIPLGIITPPEPAQDEPPKCPWCDYQMSLESEYQDDTSPPMMIQEGSTVYFMSCPRCASRGPESATEAAAVEVARKGSE